MNSAASKEMVTINHDAANAYVAPAYAPGGNCKRAGGIPARAET